jgi:C4-type Zn-finger protein
MMVNQLDPYEDWSASDLDRLANALVKLTEGGVNEIATVASVVEHLRDRAARLEALEAEEARRYRQLRGFIEQVFTEHDYVVTGSVTDALAQSLLEKFEMSYRDKSGPYFGEGVDSDDFK